jgi:pyrroline-5-carboxylate reductase
VSLAAGAAGPVSSLTTMKVGLIGAGNMARAMARGWGDPVLCSDGGSGRAQALVEELGGEALRSNREVAERADLVVLCHKPYQLGGVADQIRDTAKPIASVLGGIDTATLQKVYPQSQVFALMPNTPVEVGLGVVCYAERVPHQPFVLDAEVEAQVLELFGRLGTVVRLPEAQIGAASALMGVTPAYWALLAEAQVDAGVRHGLKPQIAGELVAASMRGTATLLAARGYDTLTVRREVTSPGGSTARGLAALEAAGVRSAFQAASDAVLQTGSRGPKPS